ncbi:hypothetical protein [Demequina litorisediminis]|uniref:Uncharacterized protein n=1 Tax=Demequina litorisediminis TaxID=1849022 RepID=A0ABQ6IDZ9_9MICO|nr:hypothetical protein [Demequina litorisediminis]GMA35212.1 hypothetical protein GCM10025876_14160 [Demequina litorisediminis]
MRLSTRIGAAVAGLALAIVGWAAPAAYADNAGGTRTASYYEDLYESKYPDRSYFCQKFEPSEGSTYGTLVDGGKAISLKPFQSSWEGDQWGLLMVKGGSVEGGEAIYEPPQCQRGVLPASQQRWEEARRLPLDRVRHVRRVGLRRDL